ncbi:hypothetical protein KJ865_07280, partial [Myxococcota bacterium]|nr:hypothetical protein [Myxococcota bacterium]
GELTLDLSMDIPDGFAQEKRRAGPGHVAFVDPSKKVVSTPRIVLLLTRGEVPSLAKALSRSRIGKKMVVKKQESKGTRGYLVVYHTRKKGLLYVKYYLNERGHILECRASLIKSGGISQFETAAGRLEKICTSIAVNTR